METMLMSFLTYDVHQSNTSGFLLKLLAYVRHLVDAVQNFSEQCFSISILQFSGSFWAYSDKRRSPSSF